MPNTKSAKKALRQNKRRVARNVVYKKKIRGLFKEIKNLISQKNIGGAEKLLPKIYKILDKAAKVGIIKKGAAARKKSRITKFFHKIFSKS